MRRWLFLPVDDRPITSRFPVQVAPLGDIELVAPPSYLLGRFLTPGDGQALAAWLEENAAGAEGAILSLDMLAYGGLIASRTSAVPLQAALDRLQAVRRLKERGLIILATSVLMRLGITGSSPESVANHHLIHQWSQAAADQSRTAEARALERAIPAAALEEYRQARLRNHRVNLEAVRMAADGVVDYLLLLQEDCSPHGVHRLEQAILQSEIASRRGRERVLLLPGTDEGALLLLARAALLHREAPALLPVYSRERTAALPAPYEDRPLRETAELQIQAGGARLGDGGIHLFINTPVQRYGDANLFMGSDPDSPELDPVCDGSPAFIERLREHLGQGRSAAVADVAFANGADPRFTPRLLAELPWTQLAGYAAWNTAGNTLGTAVAMAILHQVDGGRRERLHQEALLVRLLDDYLYQSRVRAEVAAWLQGKSYNGLNLGEAYAEVEGRVAAAMRDAAPAIYRGLERLGCRVERLKVGLPWPRIFEVNVEVGLSR